VQHTEDKRFLRGIQRTDAKGVAVFQTVYPGWYSGRTVHIHVMVHVGGNVVHTGLLRGHPDGHGVQALAVQASPQPDDPQRRRQHLPEWREALDPEAREERLGACGLDHDGCAALIVRPVTAAARRVDRPGAE